MLHINSEADSINKLFRNEVGGFIKTRAIARRTSVAMMKITISSDVYVSTLVDGPPEQCTTETRRTTLHQEWCALAIL
jgi:hypothetical protein